MTVNSHVPQERRPSVSRKNSLSSPCNRAARMFVVVIFLQKQMTILMVQLMSPGFQTTPSKVESVGVTRPKTYVSISSLYTARA